MKPAITSLIPTLLKVNIILFTLELLIVVVFSFIGSVIFQNEGNIVLAIAALGFLYFVYPSYHLIVSIIYSIKVRSWLFFLVVLFVQGTPLLISSIWETYNTLKGNHYTIEIYLASYLILIILIAIYNCFNTHSIKQNDSESKQP